MKTHTDFTLEDHGSVVLLRPHTDSAQSWLDDNIVAEGWQWFGKALAVEPRLVEPIIQGFVDDGLTLACVQTP